MNVNLREGLFLGKQELDRMLQLNRSYADAIRSLIVGYGTNGSVGKGLFGGDVIKILQTSNGYGFVFDDLHVNEGFSNSAMGRMIVGSDCDGNIGLVASSDFTEKECFVEATSLPASGKHVVYLYSLPTNYENALITIGTDGSATITKGWSFVKDLFRPSISGRQTKIKTASGQLLTVVSYNVTQHTINFVSNTDISAETNVQFMFMQTLSPLSSDTAEPLYSYDSCGVGLEAVGEGSVEDIIDMLLTEGDKIPVAIWDAETLTMTKLDSLAEANKFAFIDTVRDRQIQGRNIKLGTIQKENIDASAHGFSSYEGSLNAGEFELVAGKLLYLASADSARGGNQTVKITKQSDWNGELCTCQPSRVVFLASSTRTTGETSVDLASRISADDNISVYGLASVSEHKLTKNNYVIVDVQWVGDSIVLLSTKEVVKVPYYVVFDSYGDGKMEVITVIRDTLGCGLALAKDYAEDKRVPVPTKTLGTTLITNLAAVGCEATIESES